MVRAREGSVLVDDSALESELSESEMALLGDCNESNGCCNAKTCLSRKEYLSLEKAIPVF